MRLVTAENGVKYLFSDILGCPHGFSTRVGGVSTLSHTASLNLQRGRGDDDDTVIANLSLFARAVGIEAESIVSAAQVHSSHISLLTDMHRGQGFFVPASLECDGFVTISDSIAPSVKTADCVPILLSARNREGRVFAVAALHAGWRGTASDITTRGVECLRELGAKRESIRAAIGPSIGACCFEVDADCRDALVSALGEVAKSNITRRGAKFYPDLKAINRELLMKAGVSGDNIDVSELCTVCHPELFYSHRASGGVRGTLLSVISLK